MLKLFEKDIKKKETLTKEEKIKCYANIGATLEGIISDNKLIEQLLLNKCDERIVIAYLHTQIEQAEKSLEYYNKLIGDL